MNLPANYGLGHQHHINIEVRIIKISDRITSITTNCKKTQKVQEKTDNALGYL
jgi:hypothetical protein